jgi:hypothetical protein
MNKGDKGKSCPLFMVGTPNSPLLTIPSLGIPIRIT